MKEEPVREPFPQQNPGKSHLSCPIVPCRYLPTLLQAWSCIQNLSAGQFSRVMPTFNFTSAFTVRTMKKKRRWEFPLRRISETFFNFQVPTFGQSLESQRVCRSLVTECLDEALPWKPSQFIPEDVIATKKKIAAPPVTVRIVIHLDNTKIDFTRSGWKEKWPSVEMSKNDDHCNSKGYRSQEVIKYHLNM